MSDWIDHLASANLQNKWIGVTESGNLTLIHKDCRIARFIKSFLGLILCCDFYAHIRRSFVAKHIIGQATHEKSSVVIDKLIHLAARINQQHVATPAILDAHPEMVATFNPTQNCYSVPIESSVNTKALDQSLIERCNNLTRHVFGTSSATGNTTQDPRWIILHQLFKTHLNHPTDARGNFIIASNAHLSMKAHVPVKHLGAIDGSWWRLHIPKTAGAYPLEERVIFIKEPGTLQLKAQQIAEVIIENQKTEIKTDGTILFPNGRNFTVQDHNILLVQAEINLPVDVTPFPLTEADVQNPSFPVCP